MDLYKCYVYRVVGMTDSDSTRDRVPRRSIVISDKMWARVQEAAASLGITRAEYVRIALLERLSRDSTKSEQGAARDEQPRTPAREEMSNE